MDHVDHCVSAEEIFGGGPYTRGVPYGFGEFEIGITVRLWHQEPPGLCRLAACNSQDECGVRRIARTLSAASYAFATIVIPSPPQRSGH